VIEQLSTHMLDTVAGAPAAGIPVLLELIGPDARATVAGNGRTDADGRVGRLNAAPLAPGQYRLTFDTAQYFTAQHGTAFYPRIVVEVTLFDRYHFHLPVLAGTYSYSTYLGS
jgi:5-hydroxyisourate hydrolase